jgi:hypothetical protein
MNRAVNDSLAVDLSEFSVELSPSTSNRSMEAEPTLKPRERAYYEFVRAWLETLLKPKTSTLHLEVTADRRFSNTLQAQIDQHREIIFSFLKDARPDITGFFKSKPDSIREFLVVEVKLTPIKLDDIYQIRKYAELFDASYALLVSPHEVPERIVRLARVVFPLLSLPGYKRVTLARLREDDANVDWLPEAPF